MTTDSGSGDSSPSERLLEEASSWLMRLHELGLRSTREFEAWRQSSQEHEEAWDRVAKPWHYLGEQATAPELIALRSAALEQARRAGRSRWRDRRVPHWTFRFVAAAACLAAIALGFFYVWEPPTIYRTDVGGRRVVQLDDGSTVSLDSDSVVSVHYTKHTRELALLRGQGRFDVTHDVERPFSVVAGDRKVVATGTSFDVDLVGSEVLVTLIEGHVVVMDRQQGHLGGARVAMPHPGWELQPGERLLASASLEGSKPPIIQRVNVERATAWQAGQLVFDDETLVAAVERVNRYSRTKVVVSDPATAAIRLSGVFKEGDTQAFVDTVTRYLSLDELTRADGTVELRRRE